MIRSQLFKQLAALFSSNFKLTIFGGLAVLGGYFVLQIIEPFIEGSNLAWFLLSSMLLIYLLRKIAKSIINIYVDKYGEEGRKKLAALELTLAAIVFLYCNWQLVEGMQENRYEFFFTWFIVAIYMLIRFTMATRFIRAMAR